MKLREEPQGEGKRHTFWCPGCSDTHSFTCGVSGAPSWQYDGNADRPTIAPSLLTRCGHYAGRHQAGDECWCTYEARYGKKPPFACYSCHLFLRDGRLEFLGDCTHALAGQTVDLPDMPADREAA